MNIRAIWSTYITMTPHDSFEYRWQAVKSLQQNAQSFSCQFHLTASQGYFSENYAKTSFIESIERWSNTERQLIQVPVNKIFRTLRTCFRLTIENNILLIRCWR